MIAFNLALAALLAVPPPSDAAELAGRLGSPRYAEREDAAKALLDLGRDAVPALREAKRSKDAEVRSRAAALLERIESGLMTRATLVALDFRDRPLPEVVKAVADRSRMPVTLLPAADPPSPARRVTLEGSGPVPFWEAIDRLCRAGGLRFTMGTTAELLPGQAGSTLMLSPGRARAGRSSTDGPFLVKLVSIQHARDINLDPDEDDDAAAPGADPVREQFLVQFQVFAEPRLMVAQDGLVRLAEAVDDRGQSLKPSMPSGQPEPPDRDDFEGAGAGLGPMVQAVVPLKYPERPGKQIRRLAGGVPLMVASRKADPLVLALAGASGKAFVGAGARLDVQEVKPDAEGAATVIVLTVRPHFDPRGPADLVRSAGVGFAASRSVENQFEVVDAKGRLAAWSQTTQEPADGDGLRLTLVVQPGDDGSPPAELRYYDMTRARTEAAFEFTNVRMP